MSTASKIQALSFDDLAVGHISLSSRQGLLILVLLLMLLISAFSVVYVRDSQRELISDIQGLEIVHDNMLSQRSQLLLEQAAWRTQLRVQQVAEHQLGMVFPQKQTMIMVGS